MARTFSCTSSLVVHRLPTSTPCFHLGLYVHGGVVTPMDLGAPRRDTNLVHHVRHIRRVSTDRVRRRDKHGTSSHDVEFGFRATLGTLNMDVPCEANAHRAPPPARILETNAGPTHQDDPHRRIHTPPYQRRWVLDVPCQSRECTWPMFLERSGRSCSKYLTDCTLRPTPFETERPD
ncbi:hypothetical protein, variant 2 [Aphanomyces invadans]|uniref:Uncharacterized protein n=1 Tax=Aphanomyces invadans TaxID=157072 RepID=A0A024UAN5_9STRA|nr:hypothetical protein, variant 1 [Aphanomyces invadans]XP_008868307.1 hypothetical protein, variant 2 [Aphanomyces invadans]ETW02922.1 hypothetical protein, variant 1 [Aphanomyces invadans]ETW02923.1 hypothetical protein, variant 2 [Aphanomyces invadans]|eukprot:XP_008868306.1 hypothetical protein, variant 1 [Aphanomyces invadans]